ncbi:Glycosyl transferase family 2 [Evansella caseinilytica]|uniref:Glycosyl transferase family 2 n=1 Tax=Evansella caseinilytica TaxID=1503961 RepID=A0A1H3KZK1_9BACI|nr:glycosyltransferase family 2 protein [Evansella caseinilytica]SDY57075.1 Glycosyl transferase family 2 [Evansella caseinilytica]
MKADVIIPAYNEANRIATTLTALSGQPWVNELIVVDDGSCDDTFSIARQKSNKTMRHERNFGKQAAVYTGLKQAEADWIVMLDADLGKTASEGEKLLVPLASEEIDITIAVLPQNAKGGFGFVKRRAQRIVLQHTGVHLTAPLSGQRAFHRSWIPVILANEGVGYGLEMYLNLLFLSRGAIVKEVNTNMCHRVTGKSIKGFSHRAKQWLEMEKTVWNYS